MCDVTNLSHLSNQALYLGGADYARLQMKTRLQKTGESLQDWRPPVAETANPSEELVTLDATCESPWKSDIEKLRDEFQALMAQRQNQEKRNFKCWGCGATGHLRRNCPRPRKEENTVSPSKQEN
ncbi:hypothetical protein TNCV_4535131 [Trichonephila clavipes]|nr:hypothetical protein TNCV_4535131 [Trichonephila clavipes]